MMHMGAGIEKMWLTSAGYVGVVKLVNGKWRCGYVVLPTAHPLERCSDFVINRKIPACREITYAGWGVAGVDVNGLLFPDNWTIGFDSASYPMSMRAVEEGVNEIVRACMDYEDHGGLYEKEEEE